MNVRKNKGKYNDGTEMLGVVKKFMGIVERRVVDRMILLMRRSATARNELRD